MNVKLLVDPDPGDRRRILRRRRQNARTSWPSRCASMPPSMAGEHGERLLAAHRRAERATPWRRDA
jgi:hypothetical protein